MKYRYIEKAFVLTGVPDDLPLTERIRYDVSLTFVPGIQNPDEEGDNNPKDSDVYKRDRSNVLRAVRSIKSLGLANHWEHMVTITLSQSLLDRITFTDPKTKQVIPLTRAGYTNVMRAISRHFGNLSAKYGSSIRYLLIPELHADKENYHFHGLLAGVPPDYLVEHPDSDLAARGYYDWPDFSRKFGRFSAGTICCAEAAVYYSLKYVCKDLQQAEHDVKYSRLFYHSLNLNKPEEVFRSTLNDVSPFVILSNPKMNKSSFDTFFGRSMTSDERDRLFYQLNFVDIYSKSMNERIFTNGYSES